MEEHITFAVIYFWNISFYLSCVYVAKYFLLVYFRKKGYYQEIGCLLTVAILAFNPNKADLFEGSFFWTGVNLTPPPPSPQFIFEEELIKYQHNIIQLLKNLFKVCWKWKNADIICYKLTELVSLWQGNVKKSKKLMEIDKNS